VRVRCRRCKKGITDAAGFVTGSGRSVELELNSIPQNFSPDSLQCPSPPTCHRASRARSRCFLRPDGSPAVLVIMAGWDCARGNRNAWTNFLRLIAVMIGPPGQDLSFSTGADGDWKYSKLINIIAAAPFTELVIDYTLAIALSLLLPTSSTTLIKFP